MFVGPQMAAVSRQCYVTRQHRRVCLFQKPRFATASRVESDGFSSSLKLAQERMFAGRGALFWK